ncbi:MAG TPA: hypothetical protein VI504_03575 [Candidatus Eisenbacteria bacterium]|jgi:hypothetical protein
MLFRSSIVPVSLRAAVIVFMAATLGACSRSQSVSDSLMGPDRGGADSFQGGLPNATLSAVSLNPASVTGGTSSAGTITLTAAAPSGGLVVKLASNRTTVARVPASVTVAAGASSAAFTATTSAVTAATSATITATLGGAVRSATLAVTPAAVVAPPPPPVVVSPCVSMAGQTATVVNVTAAIPQFRASRLRVEISGDTPNGAINTTGSCAPVDLPAVSYISGTGNLVRAGTSTSVTATGAALTFGPLLFPGLALEPGVVIAQDAAGNVLEIVWPALTGLAAGPPILRLQLAQRNPAVAAGDVLDATMTFVGKAPDGTTATFSASAKGLVVPVLK